MTVDQFNKLCLYWHRNRTGQRLGQFLMNHLDPPKSDPDIYHCTDKKQASALFFERHVQIGNTSPYKTPPVNEL